MTVCGQLFIINRDKPLPSLPEPFASALSASASLISLPARALTSLIPMNRLITARRNISAHYDLGNDMFKGLLCFIKLTSEMKIDSAGYNSVLIQRHDVFVRYLSDPGRRRQIRGRRPTAG
jgi:hypothetical protein